MQTTKRIVFDALRKDMLRLQGLNPSSEPGTIIDLGPVNDHLPNATFPTGAIHEFISNEMETAAATTGFIFSITSFLMQSGKPCLWIGSEKTIYPNALKTFNLLPEQVIFIDTVKDKDVLWAIEEALQCASLAAVIGEIRELDFTQSRRLQLAVENSHVTGFIHRQHPRSIKPTACVSRWRILPMPGQLPDDLPGIGLPRWSIELLKIRNGRPGSWQLEWTGNTFKEISQTTEQIHSLKTAIA